MSTTKETQLLNLFRQVSTLSVLQLPDELELSRPAINLLSWINSSPGCGVVDIARGLHLSPPTISVGIRRLVNGGWLEKRYETSDRRMQQIYLTNKSINFLNGLKAYQTKLFTKFLSNLSFEEIDQLIALLEKAVQGISDRTND
jgi:DNA-binding MarR family transcriptional regulator